MVVKAYLPQGNNIGDIQSSFKLVETIIGEFMSTSRVPANGNVFSFPG